MSSVHRETFASFVQQHGWARGAELGVDKGILFHLLLSSCPTLNLIGVDVCPILERRDKCRRIAEQYEDRAFFYEMTTSQAASFVPDGSLDFVFIDADHSYAAVDTDIREWYPKVREGGWVGGHDYHPRKFPGVVKAVTRAFGAKSVHHLPGTIWGVWK